MRTSAPFVIAFSLALIVWIFWRPAGHTFFEYIGWIGSAGAAVFAAVSARATLATVQEMRLTRQQEQRPQLTFEAGADYFLMFWPNLKAAPAEQMHPRFERHNRNPSELSEGIPNLTLENFGGGAAVDISIRFMLDDDGSAIDLPVHYKAIPFGSTNRITLRKAPGNEKFTILSLSRPGNSFVMAPLSKVDRFQPHCGPGKKRNIEIPEGIIWMIALRSMQEAGKPKGMFSEDTKRDLKVEITYKSALENCLSENFYFEVKAYVWPNPINGGPKNIWAGVSPEELRISLEFAPKPRNWR